VTGLRKRLSGFMVRETNGEYLLLDTESDRIHQLNRTASLIWRGCDGAASPEEIAAILAKEFDVAEDKALADVVKTLEKLRSIGALE
jgi:hypothetical protein